MLGTGEVVVDVAAAPVASYAVNVFNGSRNYPLELPLIPGPGGIGRVRATGPDATKLRPGDWVFVDSTIRSRDNIASPEQILLGWTYRTPAALPLHRYFHHGSFAEQMLVPTENATPIGRIEPSDAGRWTVLGRLLVPFGGLARRRFAGRRDAGRQRRNRGLRRRGSSRGIGNGGGSWSPTAIDGHWKASPDEMEAGSGRYRSATMKRVTATQFATRPTDLSTWCWISCRVRRLPHR